MTEDKKVYLALAFGLPYGMTAYGKAELPGYAVRNCFREIKQIPSIRIKPGARIRLVMFDHTPWDTISWDDRGAWGLKDEKEEKLTPVSVWTVDEKGFPVDVEPRC